MIEEKEDIFYKKNVPYRVGVRTDIKDHEGTVLDDDNPYVQVERRDLRKFLQANKLAIQSGLIIEVDEPPLQIVTPNSISDDEALNLVKNYHLLRKRLPELTSETAVNKLLLAAKASGRTPKTIQMITDRLEEVSPSVMGNVT